MKGMPRMLAVTLVAAAPALAQIHDTQDDRVYYRATATLVADASYNVKRMVLTPLSGDEISGGISNQYVRQKMFNTVMAQGASQAFSKLLPDLFNIYESSAIPMVAIIYSAADIALTLASSNNVKARDYFIYAPAAATYSFRVNVPGDIDKPCNMIKIFAVDANGNQTQVYNYDQDASSDRTVQCQANLPAGLCHINVSVGSGTLKFHSAGTLQLAMLDNPYPVQWSLSGVPVTTQQISLLDLLPQVGNTASFHMDASLPATPINILEGSVSYSSIQPVPAILPADAQNSSASIHYYGPIPDEDWDKLGIFPSLHMKAVQVGDPVNTGNGGTWTFTRQDDYTTRYVCHPIMHPYNLPDNN